MHALQVTAAASGLLCTRCPAAMNVLIVLPGALDTFGRVERGDVVPVRFGKWGGRWHWEMDLRYLGADQFGDWLGSPAGMPMRRPGWTTQTDAECAFLVPSEGDFVASFNGRGVPTAIYVDVTDTRWDGETVRAVDLDLDVVKA